MSSSDTLPSTKTTIIPAFSLKTGMAVLMVCLLPFISKADSIKFNVKNTTKNVVTVFYKIDKRSGVYKLRSLVKLAPGEQKIKEVSVAKGDTIEFYGQDPQVDSFG